MDLCASNDIHTYRNYILAKLHTYIHTTIQTYIHACMHFAAFRRARCLIKTCELAVCTRPKIHRAEQESAEEDSDHDGTSPPHYLLTKDHGGHGRVAASTEDLPHAVVTIVRHWTASNVGLPTNVQDIPHGYGMRSSLHHYIP